MFGAQSQHKGDWNFSDHLACLVLLAVVLLTSYKLKKFIVGKKTPPKNTVCLGDC